MTFKIDFEKLNKAREYETNRLFCVVSGDKAFNANKFVFLPVGDTISTVFANDILFSACDKLLTPQIEKGMAITIITSDNNGADSLALDYAIHKDYDCQIVKTEWDELGKRAGFLKNEEMFYQAHNHKHHAGVLMWDGEDIMTRNLIYQAYCFSVPIRVYNYSSKSWLSQAEINNIQSDERHAALTWRQPDAHR